MTANKNITVA